ncbi:MAG: putative porin [Opitutaceae bacterium]|nr:putative porin [Verrucomicrobiales bacterium]
MQPFALRKTSFRWGFRVLFMAAVLGVSITSHAATGVDWIDNNTNLTFYGDIRLRYELDWDSQNASGVMRADRDRGRIRARAGFNYQITDDWSVGARVRTGNSQSQQSPHLTFASTDGVHDDLDFVLDRYFVQFKHEGFSGWGGRNTTPFWYQNELFWDEDVTPTGVAGSYAASLGEGMLTTVAGAFYLPDGGYYLNGQMLAAQVKYSVPVKSSQVTVAAGLYYMNGEPGADYLLNRNGARDYLIGMASAQWVFPVKGIPLSLGADVFHNFQDYSAADVAPFPAADSDQTLGYVLSVQLGQLKQRHDWLAGYYYAHIETFAVNASYAQDDWVRFGNGAQTDASDFQGHEVRLGYAVSKNINVLARLYLVNAITTIQDGNRFRFDFNWKF